MEPGLSCRDLQIPVRERRRESFRIQTLQAWDEYRLTGLHLNAARQPSKAGQKPMQIRLTGA